MFRIQQFHCHRRSMQAAVNVCFSAALLGFLTNIAGGQSRTTHDPEQYGPYNGAFLADGLGLKEPIANGHDSILQADFSWTMSCWFKSDETITGLH